MSNFLRASCSGAKNFFPLPNAIFSLGLSAGELAVYAYLMYCEDRKSHQCWPSYKTIGKAVGMSENTVRKYVRELEYKVLILTELKIVSGTGSERRFGPFVTICEGHRSGRRIMQICRVMEEYPAPKGAENGQKDKQVKARGLPRNLHRPAEPVVREKSGITGPRNQGSVRKESF